MKQNTLERGNIVSINPYGESPVYFCKIKYFKEWDKKPSPKFAMGDWYSKDGNCVKDTGFDINFCKLATLEDLNEAIKINHEVIKVQSDRLAKEMGNEKLDLYKSIPPEFVRYIESVSYERGHSAGEEEIDSIACSMVREMKSYIDEYTNRIKALK